MSGASESIKGKTTACTLRIDRNLQWYRTDSLRQLGFHG